MAVAPATTTRRSRSRGRGANARSNGHRPAATSIPPVPFEHEELGVRRGRRSGVYTIVAVHSTALGPALGGLRVWRYATPVDASRDALRLARGMTLKAAAAGLDLGGGKGVVCVPDGDFGPARRRDALLDFGDLVESLEGRYITAEDVGVSPGDLEVIAERTSHVTGRSKEHGGSGDPSPVTAIGVESAMRACARERFGAPELAGRRIVVIGLGHVGGHLARRLAAAGADLCVSDVEPRKRSIASALGADWIDPADAPLAECDLLAPCALGGTVDADNVEKLRCEVLCGAANNQLAEESLAAVLDERGILFAPDFIVNAGGLINVFREIRGYAPEHARELACGIEETMATILATARERGTTPLEAARDLAGERLGAAGGESRPQPVAVKD
jgi:leucine dehydrogenase